MGTNIRTPIAITKEMEIVRTNGKFERQLRSMILVYASEARSFTPYAS
jgi:hypothetical protein